ncbi:MAG TPA: hypothetical protein VLU25_20440, partial [Acidobacteriota bacterium]|nr:hypothetical protein [Acidobacteriota bacterium]
GGVIRFRNPAFGIAGVQSSPPLSGFTVPVRNEGGINTGVALHNVQDSPISLQFQLLDTQGMEVAGTMMAGFPARAQTAVFITELFDGVDLAGGFKGSLVARSQGGSVAAMALELGTQAGEFTALPVSPLR